MKNYILLLFFFFSISICKSQTDYLGLASIEHGHARISYYETAKRSPDNLKATSLGGSIDTYLKLDNGCIEKYRFVWSFDQDISKIELGSLIGGTLNASLLSGGCNNNNAYITASGANNGSTIINNTRKGGNGLEVQGNRAHPVGYSHLPKSTKFTIKIASNSVPDESYVVIKIATTTDASNKDVFDYEIRYNYNRNAPASSGGAINCYALYDFGVNIGMIEYGSLKNDSPSFLIGFIDNAIIAIKGIGCLSTAYLEDLKLRMSTAPNSSPFNNEISEYRQALPAMIQDECRD